MTRWCGNGERAQPPLSAVIVDNVAQPMEIAHLLYRKDPTCGHYLGGASLEKRGLKRWTGFVFDRLIV